MKLVRGSTFNTGDFEVKNWCKLYNGDDLSKRWIAHLGSACQINFHFYGVPIFQIK